jgi:hypothetical protein
MLVFLPIQNVMLCREIAWSNAGMAQYPRFARPSAHAIVIRLVLEEIGRKVSVRDVSDQLFAHKSIHFVAKVLDRSQLIDIGALGGKKVAHDMMVGKGQDEESAYIAPIICLQAQIASHSLHHVISPEHFMRMRIQSSLGMQIDDSK